MNEQEQLWFRLGLLSELVAQAPAKLGRTALMKLAYLLQTIRGVPLGYDFRLYTYGPFDSDLLSDLGAAESLGAVKSEIVLFPSGSGYGYEFVRGAGCDSIRKRVGHHLDGFQADVSWALAEFGQLSAADLELLSTIIYADRQAARQHKRISSNELRKTVKAIKPKFDDAYIDSRIKELGDKELLKCNRTEQRGS